MDAGVLQVEGVGVSLGAVADDGYLLGLNEGKVGIVIVICLRHGFLGFPFVCVVVFLNIGCRSSAYSSIPARWRAYSGLRIAASIRASRSRGSRLRPLPGAHGLEHAG